MNGWSPKLNASGDILSGNAGIWLTRDGQSSQLSPIGVGPVWAGFAPIYNRNDGTTWVNGDILPFAYNYYSGSERNNWVGGNGPGSIEALEIYSGLSMYERIPNAAVGKFGGPYFCYLTPYQSVTKSLIRNGGTIATGPIVAYALSVDGAVLLYTTDHGGVKQIWSDDNHDISIRTDEVALNAFIGPGGQPWMFSGTNHSGSFVRPCLGPDRAFGYVIAGDLYYPDARMQGPGLRVVGSSDAGVLREVWIDFSVPRVDLRLV